MKEVKTNQAPAAVGPYSQGISTGNLVYLSGQLGLDPHSGEMQDGIKNQTVQAFKNIQGLLESEGLSLDHVVKVLVLLADINDFSTVNNIYAEQFSEPFPARSAFAVKDLPLGGLVEIEVIAERTE
ncbi:MAG TPA: RidA family protein [Alloiococcus sp.]|nr:RidA family protein [Alloiococcus sp.]